MNVGPRDVKKAVLTPWVLEDMVVQESIIVERT